MLKVRTGEICLKNLQFEEGVYYEKADHYMDCCGVVPLLLYTVFRLQGSIVEGICGIAIAAALGVFGYLAMK